MRARVLALLLFPFTPLGGQERQGFNPGQLRRHDQIFPRQFQVQFLHQLHDVHVLPGDFSNGDIVNIHLVLLDEMEQEVQRPLKHIQLELMSHFYRVSLL